ncbi:MAG: hypothetical protein D3904_08450 [Candidatus Electrothrix sp. EH2]|nr:hypothetical protein [Candidatus Electrothrix sp. EH2]
MKQLEEGEPISQYTQQYLRKNGLLALLDYQQRQEVIFSAFLKNAQKEQSERRAEAEAARAKAMKESAEKRLQEKARLAQLKKEQKQAAAPRKKKKIFESPPVNKNKEKQDQLRRKYDLSCFIERNFFPKVMEILRKVDSGGRLCDEEVIWLSTEAEEYYTEELKEAYHRNEAIFYADQFKKHKDPWASVNASSHYRKCNEAETADKLLQAINIDKFKNVKLKSALCTTHGGVKRDLGQWEKALALGEQAHRLTPKNFRPCTLLGAVNMEVGRHETGRSWYDKAVERGYSEKAMDNELRRIFKRAEGTDKEKLKDYLLNLDPHRYSWATL